MRASSRVRARSTSRPRSRSASAAVGIQTPVRAIACRNRADDETPAADAFARHEASSRAETPEHPSPDPAKTPIEGWKPRRLPGGEWGAVLTGPDVAELPGSDQLPRTPIVVTDNKGDAWTTTLVDVVSRTDDTIVVRTAGRPRD